MKKLLSVLLLTAVAIVWYSCEKEGRIDHIDGRGYTVAPVTDVKITPTSGGAIVTFVAPKDPNLLYIKAAYDIRPGVSREARTSVYSDTLLLEGFADTLEHSIKIYSVGKNEKAGEPLEVRFKPLKSAVLIAFDSLSIEQAFGGVRIRYGNPELANLSVVLLSDTAGDGYYLPLQTFPVSGPRGTLSFRGLPPVQKNFAVYLRDRWQNRSDTLKVTLTPMYEEAVPKPFTALILPTDETTPVEPQYTLSKMWDGIIDGGIFASRHSTTLPQWFTIDLGRNVVISRLKMHQRGESYTYTGSNVKQFELWGSNDPNKDGSWTNWTYLGTFNSFKPSGDGPITADDRQYAAVDGEDFDLSFVPPAYRYVRFKTTNTWGGGPQITISELSFWGQLK